MMKTLLRAGLALALSCGAAAGAQAQTIQNGSFELDTVTGGFNTRSDLTGWTVTGTVDLIGNYWQAPTGGGSQSLDLNGNGLGAIQQTVGGLTTGLQYFVSFFVSGNPDNGRQPQTKLAELTLGTGTNAVSYTLGAQNTAQNMQWEQRTFSFIASGDSAVIRLASLQNNEFGLAVDNFSITAAPEPGTWAMMIFGFGAVGATLRRRRRSTTAALATA